MFERLVCRIKLSVADTIGTPPTWADVWSTCEITPMPLATPVIWRYWCTRITIKGHLQYTSSAYLSSGSRMSVYCEWKAIVCHICLSVWMIRCVLSCTHCLMGNELHNLYVICLGVELAWSAREGTGCSHWDHFTVRKLHLRLALFTVPRGSGPVAAEAVWRLRSWGLQVELAEDLEKGISLSRASSANSVALRLDWEARSAAFSVLAKRILLAASCSEELDLTGVETDIINAIGCSITAAVAICGWTCQNKRDREKTFLLDAPILPSGLFGTAKQYMLVTRFSQRQRLSPGPI